jgi:hypothetical protein
MKKNLSRFEQSLQEKLGNYEMPYEHSSWVSLQRQMGMARTGGSVWIVSLVSTILALSGGAFALYRHQHTPSLAQKASLDSRFAVIISNTTKGVSHGQGTEGTDQLQSSLTLFENQSAITQTQNSAVNPGLINSTSSSSDIFTPPSEATAPSSQMTKPDNVIAFACNVRKACQGEEVEFQTSNGPKSGSYLWNFGDGHFSDDVNPKHKFAKAGDYDVSLSITSDNGQINTTVINDMITIEAAPDANFAWEFVNSDPSQPEVQIVNLSEGGTQYEWSNGSESSVMADGARFRLKVNGRQMIALNAKNAAGCTDGAVKHISVNSDFALGAPNQWSMKNGAFMPQGLKKSKVDFVLSIFDKDGAKVFTTNNRQKGWDGKLPSGTLAAAGSTYSYKVIITTDFAQEQQYFNGTFSVFP